MIIPKEYGGLGFSGLRALAGGDASCRRARAPWRSRVMVPNSLGPGELLAALRHRRAEAPLPAAPGQGPRDPLLRADQPERRLGRGVDSRLRHRLLGRVRGQARCSACASPGTSATSRWARSRRCSASRSALYDPDHLLGDKEDLGITCALIPTTHPGVEIGRRHMPLNAVFQNGPNWGKDVFIPMDWVIGGQPMVGPRLAHADGVPRRGPRDLAAVVGAPAWPSSPCARPAPTRACARSSRRRSASSRASRRRWRAWAATST